MVLSLIGKEHFETAAVRKNIQCQYVIFFLGNMKIEVRFASTYVNSTVIGNVFEGNWVIVVVSPFSILILGSVIAPYTSRA